MPQLMTIVLIAVGLGFAAVAIDQATVARAAGVRPLQQRIRSTQGRVSGLSGAIASQSQRIAALGHSISSLQVQLSQKQAVLAKQIAQLRATQADYTVTQARLLRLEAYEARAESVLRQQMVGQYESQQPDLITVILNARGFQDLLERLQFAQRIQQQDARVVTQVRTARRAVSAAAIRLGALEVRERTQAAQVLAARNGLARTQLALIEQRGRVAQSRSANTARLDGVRAQLVALRGQLARIRAAEAAAARRAALAAARASTPAAAAPRVAGAQPSAPSPVSGGGFTFPLPPSAASPPGSWSLDQGVDISAPGGTPEYAVCSGTIVLHGIGGFGPWAPVLHCDSPVGGYSYVYYGHAGPANQLPVGTHVGAGQVMSEVGPGIVGMSTGPHLEIGFSDSSGTPIGGGSASTMLSLLHGAYHG